jgi:two-component system, OmpR family, sensor histidine kinase KdpD
MVTRLIPPRPSLLRVVAVAFLAPAGAVGLGHVFGSENLAAATALCLLAVVIAAAIAGRMSGLLASIVAFVALNFFFTHPRHTLTVSEASDWVALSAFLICAAVVGTLLSRTLEERERAERRALEAQVLSQSAARLIVSDSFDAILGQLATSLVELFALAECRITTEQGTGTARARDVAATGPDVSIPLTTPTGSVGSLSATRTEEGSPFSSDEVELLETLASQTALAVERAALDRQVRAVSLEAEASALRAALFSSVTHDLKTPLASIKASASGLLAEGARYSKEQRDGMALTIIEETDHLTQIVGNLLDLARMRVGALVPTKQPVYVDDVLASVLRRLSRQLEPFDIEVKLRGDMPTVEADPTQLEQVFSNVLENAARFSPHGSTIQIAGAVWQSSVQIRVTDHGPGIPAEDRERVFKEFFSQSKGQAREGTGLGLAIARAIVEGHGGRIRATDAPGGGTSIVFELPMSRVERAEAADQEQVVG